MDKRKINKIAISIFAVIVGLLLLIIIFGDDSSNTDNDKNTTQNVEKKDEKKSEKKEKITQDDAEKYCQDANLLSKYINMKNVKLIDMWDYKPAFNEDIDIKEDGTHVDSFQWRGKDKTTDDSLLFVCNVSGTKDNITLESLAVGGEVLYTRP